MTQVDAAQADAMPADAAQVDTAQADAAQVDTAQAHSAQVDTAQADSAQADAPTLARRLCAAVALIADVVVAAEADGHVAVVHLDPLFVMSRAEQQGLDDSSIAAAAADPRVCRLIADEIARLNADAPHAERIARFEIAG